MLNGKLMSEMTVPEQIEQYELNAAANRAKLARFPGDEDLLRWIASDEAEAARLRASLGGQTIRTLRNNGERVPLDVACILDSGDYTTDERIAMQRSGRAEWRINLDAKDPREESIFVLVPPTEPAS